MLFVDLVSGECDAAKTCCIAVTANCWKQATADVTKMTSA